MVRLFYDAGIITSMFDELVWSAFSRNFQEKDGKYEFTLMVPGIKKEDIEVYTRNGQLFVETKTRKVSFSLPEDAGEIKSKLELGLLTVTIQKQEVKKNSIEIE